MVRKIIAGILIVISSIMLGLSITGIALVWKYQELVGTAFYDAVTGN